MKRYLLFLLPAFSASYSHALNLADLIQRSRQLTGDTPYYTASPKLSDQRIIDYLNEGSRYAAAQGWFLTARTTFSLVAGTTEYFLPADYQTTRRVSLDGNVIPEITLDALDYNSGNWLSISGAIGNYYIRTTSVSVMGFYPAPTTTSTGVVTADYIAQNNVLAALTDVPFLGLPELTSLHESLPKFVAYRYFLTIGNTPLANIYGQEFLGDVKRMKEIIETKPNYRPGASAITGRQ